MTIGIYALYWGEPSLIYIGKAVDIEKRFREHYLDLLEQRHCNYKLQKTYNIYGNPENIIIEKTQVSLLNDLEVKWIKEFNSTVYGLNITGGGDGAGSGVHNSASKYSKRVVLKVFSHLSRSLASYKSISEKLKVPIHLCKSIGNGDAHLWLNEEYPEKYTQMTKNIPNRINSNSLEHRYSEVLLVSPSGEIVNVLNIKEFCTSNSLNPGNISSLISGRYNSSKGWKLYNKKPAK